MTERPAILVLKNGREHYLALGRQYAGYGYVDRSTAFFVNGEPTEEAPGDMYFRMWVGDELVSLETRPGPRSVKAGYKKKPIFEGSKHPDTLPADAEVDTDEDEIPVVYDAIYEQVPQDPVSWPFRILDIGVAPKAMPVGIASADPGYIGKFPFIWHAGPCVALHEFIYPRLRAQVLEICKDRSYLQVTHYDHGTIWVSFEVKMGQFSLKYGSAYLLHYENGRETYKQVRIQGADLDDTIAKVDAWIAEKVKPILDMIDTRDTVMKALAAVGLPTAPPPKPAKRRRGR